jgi:glycosyltransferase involved in cell wall biosynthesis
MKIAVFHNLPSGGAKRALYGFVKYLVKSGHAVDILVPSTANESFLPLRDFVGKFEVFPVRRTFAGLIGSALFYFPSSRYFLADIDKTESVIASAINERDYDVVLSEQDEYVMSPFLLKYIEKPGVYYCQQPQRIQEAIFQRISDRNQSVDLPAKVRRKLSKWFAGRRLRIDKQNASFAKYILANSYFSRESILRSYGLNSFVCYLGVDTDIFVPLAIPKGDYVLTVGACYPLKGYDFIVESLSYVSERVRPKLIIVSNSVDTAWKNYLQQLALHNRVELEVRSLVNDEELVALYNKARLVVYAPYLEPFGLVPLEAMACGTPVIAVKEGGVRESVLHNETGILTERDEVMFAEAISELLLDEQRRLNMSRKGLEVVKAFWTLEHAGQRLLWHLERAVSLRHLSAER